MRLVSAVVLSLVVLAGCTPTEDGPATIVFALDQGSCFEALNLNFYIDGVVEKSGWVNTYERTAVTTTAGYHSAGAREVDGGRIFADREVLAKAFGSTTVVLQCN